MAKKKTVEVVETKYFKDLLTRNIYEVKADKMKEYTLYRNRYTVSVMLGVLTYGIGVEMILAATLSVFFAIVFEFRYRRKFLPNLNVRNHMNIDRNVNTQALVMNSILYVILGVILLGLALTDQKNDSTLQIFMIGTAIGSLGISGMYFTEYLGSKQKKY